MAKFPPPPVRTKFELPDPIGQGKVDSPSYPWERHFQDITTRLNSPQLPRLTPKSSTATGVADSIIYDANFVYICVAPNTWKRVPLNAF